MSGAKSGDDRAACTPLARRVPDFAPLIRATKKEKEAERRQTRISYLRAPTFILPRSRGRREEGDAPPVGVPPRHLLQRANAAAQLGRVQSFSQCAGETGKE